MNTPEAISNEWSEHTHTHSQSSLAHSSTPLGSETNKITSAGQFSLQLTDNTKPRSRDGSDLQQLQEDA